MTKDQMKWAKQHDWFVGVREVAGIHFVKVREHLLVDGKWEEQVLEFKFFGELKAWAGY